MPDDDAEGRNDEWSSDLMEAFRKRSCFVSCRDVVQSPPKLEVKILLRK